MVNERLRRGRLVAVSERLGPLTEAEEGITAAGDDVRVELLALWNRDDIVNNARDATVIVVGAAETVDERVFEELQELKAVVRRGVGVDNVDLDAATRAGVVVAHVPDASVEEVSDHAFALLLALERHVVASDLRTRGFDRKLRMSPPPASSRRLRDLTLGVVGLGRIGWRLAEKTTAVFGEVVAHDPALSQSAGPPGVRLVAFRDLIGVADAVSVHVPLTEQTTHMFDGSVLTAMKMGSHLVNTSRGEIVDEDALVSALEHGPIAGAALDVTQAEPLPDEHPLTRFANVILTGHTAAKGQRSSSEMRRRSAEAATAIIRGHPPEHIANPQVLHSAQLRIGVQAAGRIDTGEERTS